jgi:hypothetical protein
MDHLVDISDESPSFEDAGHEDEERDRGEELLRFMVLGWSERRAAMLSVSFVMTAGAFDDRSKTDTRRFWKPRHAAKFKPGVADGI